jgi:outer membrane PBP1 activator LpoA protein
MKSVLLILSLSSLLAACSPGDPDPKIAEDQREVMNEAKQVEDLLQQSAEQTRQQVDEQAQ